MQSDLTGRGGHLRCVNFVVELSAVSQCLAGLVVESSTDQEPGQEPGQELRRPLTNEEL